MTRQASASPSQPASSWRIEPRAETSSAAIGSSSSEHRRVGHQRSGDRHPLRLPSGQRRWSLIARSADPESIERRLGRGECVASADASGPQPERDVLACVEVVEQAVGLEHRADTAVGRRYERVRSVPGATVHLDAAGAGAGAAR